MQRPQWIFRHGLPAYRYRWHAKAWHVDLQYNTLDVDDADVDNFFKITGQPLEEPTFRELVSAAEYRRRHSVEAIKAKRIANIAAHVEEYLKIKAWRVRLRHAVSDLEWNFEPYRKQYETLKKEREKAALEQKRAEDAAEHERNCVAARLAEQQRQAEADAKAKAYFEGYRAAAAKRQQRDAQAAHERQVAAAREASRRLAARNRGDENIDGEPEEIFDWRKECERAYTSYLQRHNNNGMVWGPFGIKVEDQPPGSMPYIVYGRHDCAYVGKTPPASGVAIGAVFLHAFEFIRCLHCGYARRLTAEEMRKRRIHHQQGGT